MRWAEGERRRDRQMAAVLAEQSALAGSAPEGLRGMPGRMRALAAAHGGSPVKSIVENARRLDRLRAELAALLPRAVAGTLPAVVEQLGALEAARQGLAAAARALEGHGEAVDWPALEAADGPAAEKARELEARRDQLQAAEAVAAAAAAEVRAYGRCLAAPRF